MRIGRRTKPCRCSLSRGLRGLGSGASAMTPALKRYDDGATKGGSAMDGGRSLKPGAGVEAGSDSAEPGVTAADADADAGAEEPGEDRGEDPGDDAGEARLRPGADPGWAAGDGDGPDVLVIVDAGADVGAESGASIPGAGAAADPGVPVLLVVTMSLSPVMIPLLSTLILLLLLSNELLLLMMLLLQQLPPAMVLLMPGPAGDAAACRLSLSPGASAGAGAS